MHKPVKFKKCWNIFIGISAVILLLVCLSKTRFHKSRPYILIPFGWNLSAFKNSNLFSGVSILENTSENVEASSSSLQELSNQTSKPFKNVTYHGHDLLKDVSILASGLRAPNTTINVRRGGHTRQVY